MKRQLYFDGAGEAPDGTVPAKPIASRTGGAVFVLLLMFLIVLVAYIYRADWSPLTGGKQASSALSRAPAQVEEAPLLIPAQAPVTRTASIPPLDMSLVAAPISGLPTVVRPVFSGETAPADPIVARQPRMPERPIPAVLRVPAGKGPFPAVIVLHGCNGPFTGTPDWAYRLNAWGYAALMPDSMTPRGIKSVCDPAEQPRVTPWDRVGDVAAAAVWLRAQPEIDPDRIGVLGVSHGGAAAALTAASPYSAMRLRAAVDYYGPCVEPRLHGSVPLLVLAGDKDDWGDPAAVCQAYGRELPPDQSFEVHTYAGVYHGFDSGPSAQTILMGHIIQHNQSAAEDSFVRVRAFLNRWVRP